MRNTLLIAAALVACASAAAAQPAVLVKSKPIHGTVPEPLADLPNDARVWIRKEGERQFKSPTSLYDLELAMLLVMSDDLERMARHKKLSFDELSVIVLQQVISRSATEMDQAVRERRKDLARSGAAETADPQMRDLLKRKAALLTQINELKPRMTPNSRMLTARK